MKNIHHSIADLETIVYFLFDTGCYLFKREVYFNFKKMLLVIKGIVSH